MPKPIFINGRFLAQPQTGVQRYATEVMKALDHLIDCHEIDAGGYSLIILVPPESCCELPLKHIEVRTVGHLKGNLWEQISLPWHARSGLLFSPCNIGPVAHFNQVVTIHDASVYAVPEAYTWTFRAKYRIAYRILGLTSKIVFTVSQFSKRELVRYCGIASEKIVVIPEGTEHILSVEADESVFEKHKIPKDSYVFCAGSNSPHKNFSLLEQAFRSMKRFDFNVVIAGGTFSQVFQVRDQELPENAKVIGYVSDSELRALYEHAICFIFPSYYEGFGLPPLEAMSLGCPVIVSNTASLPEICGRAALYVGPSDAIELANKMDDLLNHNEIRSLLSALGKRQAQAFSWYTTAKQIWGAIVHFEL